MYLAYFDESGDDGYPRTSSNLFVLSCIYMNAKDWKDNYLKIFNFRRALKTDYGFPIKQEFHTKSFIQDKNPYHGKYSEVDRLQILRKTFNLISTLNVKIINVCINKSRITSPSYNVLENALKYSIQRIENDMMYSLLRKSYLIISDEGRIFKMTRITREIQRINYIPSHFGNKSYRSEIKYLIEDPLPKKSSHSYYIQLCDLLSYISNLYVQRRYCDPKMDWPRRVLNVIPYGEEEALLGTIKNVINLKASKYDPFGIVCYPK